MAEAAHTALIGAEGATDITHPDPDHDNCDFAAYLAQDWATNPPMMHGSWSFHWMDGYWNGTKDD